MQNTQISFPIYFLFGLLEAAHQPQQIGIPCFRKQIVWLDILRSVVENAIETAVALGAARPTTAISLISHMLSIGDLSQQQAEELWHSLDPTEQINCHPDLYPPQAIMAWPFDAGQNEGLTTFDWPCIGQTLKYSNCDYVEWRYFYSNKFGIFYQSSFAEGLVWGLSYPQEASSAHESQRKSMLKKTSQLIDRGIDLHYDPQQACPTLEELCVRGENLVAMFQATVRPFNPIPPELLSLPQIASRFRS